MRNQFRQLNYVFHFLGLLLWTLGLVFLAPLVVVFIYWGEFGDGWGTVLAFVIPAASSFVVGLALRKGFQPGEYGVSGSMLICALGWILVSAFGALPFVIGIGSTYLDGYFEAMSGFTTTGITVFTGLDAMPRSIIFWRSLTQWVGGLGILSFFLAVTFRVGAAHHIFGAESHKISAKRPVPGLSNTVKILWGIYGLLTALSVVTLCLEGMPVFDSVNHTMTALSTGGFSPYDASIGYYREAGYANYRVIEYTLVFVMLLGGMNFLVHYRVLTGDFKALWDNVEIRYWWCLIVAFIVLIVGSQLLRAGPPGGEALEPTIRGTAFQTVSILTTTGFATRDIGSDFFPALARQLFLLMMVIGGCVGSTGGGIKVLRVAVLTRLVRRELFKLRAPGRASSGLVIDGKIVPEEEIRRVSSLFFAWMGFLAAGGVVTALFSDQGALESFSGMFSALGNIGPSFIPAGDMAVIHPVVKLVYTVGMLAGRLEILPVMLLFSKKAWR
jgi:trk system potassium uptake protein TrkH